MVMVMAHIAVLSLRITIISPPIISMHLTVRRIVRRREALYAAKPLVPNHGDVLAGQTVLRPQPSRALQPTAAQ
jgi:hypothetical protein